MNDQLVETWLINNRVMLLMLANLSPKALECTLSTRGGRTVGQQLAHVYEVRRSYLEVADKTLLKGLPKITRDDGHDAALLKRGFEASGEAIAELIRRSLANGGKVKGSSRGIVVLVGYLIAHDAHHRGHALLTIKQSGISLNERLRWGLWAWNQI